MNIIPVKTFIAEDVKDCWAVRPTPQTEVVVRGIMS